MWLATGDGGLACDPNENAQNLDSLLGKLLRITPKASGGYTVPKDNPFVKKAGADEIYSYGLRNPFRFSFDKKSIWRCRATASVDTTRKPRRRSTSAV